ncbi:MAG: MFS transporter [Opitutae bacterium]|nr:MFS transporter [Opitutae bacterium]|tara:strand:- start:5306 stop:6652 length:1347 start_codon:yes stop_codon:yes gene_type:complete
MSGTESLTDKQKRATFGVVFLTIFMDMVGFSVIFPLFPSMLDHYLTREASMGGGLVTSFVEMVKGYGFDGADGGSFRLETVIFGGALGSLYAILQFVFAPIWGRFSDRVGRRPVLLLTLGGTCLGYGLWIFAGSFWILVLSRIIGGIASGNLSVATASIADVTSRKDRSKGMAIVGIAFGLGFVLGPALGGYASSWDWSTESESALALTPFSLAALISFCLALVNWSWLAMRFRETLPAAKRGEENEQPRPAIFQLKKVANPAVRRTCLSYLCYMISFSGMEFTLTFLAVERYLYQPRDITSMFLLIGFTLIFAQGFFVRRFVGKIGEKNMALQGISLGFIAFILLAFPSSESWFFFALFLMSCGVAFISPTLTALTSLHSSEQDQGFNLGIFRSSGSIARACGPMLAGLTYFLFGSTFAYTIGAFLLLIPFLILLKVPKPARDDPAK